jgi:phenylacetic acid degradation operon negative regulatory protein
MTFAIRPTILVTTTSCTEIWQRSREDPGNMTTLVPDDSELDEAIMPRSRSGAQPQHLLITLLGDYWLGRDEHLPSAGLVDLLAEFGISATSARAALGRLTRRGLLHASKSGRRTFYGLTPLAIRVLDEGLSRILSFGTESTAPWDGTWLVVAFSVPEEQRDIRHALRSRLRWQGFAPLYDGVWVSPRSDDSAVKSIMSDLGVETATVLRSSALYPQASGPGHPLSAWDLDEVREAYDNFIDKYSPLLERIRLGQVTASEALVERTIVMDTWRQFPNLDPELPSDALPEGWPRQAAHEIFSQVYDGLGPLAELRAQQIIGLYEPEIARGARHHTIASAVARLPQ